MKKEDHPLFPSGEWEGFYDYPHNKEQHKMTMLLEFKKNKVKGQGSDNIGAFAMKGNYSTETMLCDLMKTYTTHQIKYNGHVDENGIWGIWTAVKNEYKGGFHIWPKANNAVKKAKAVKANMAIA